MSESGSEQVAKSLYDAAWMFLHLKFSVIPVYGDQVPEQAKVAAVDWKPYQMRFASVRELHHWFFNLGARGMAFVTGKISRLVVLDFDDEMLAQMFFWRFRDLCETRIIHSAQRKLPHVYLRLPVGVSLPSHRFKGLDVQSDGRYIIAPPTTIAGEPYRVVRAGMPKELTRSQVERLQRFLDELVSIQSVHVPTVQATTVDTPPAPTIPMRTAEECRNYYLAVAPHVGRNNALFRAAIMMRDTGWTYEAAQEVLQPLHVLLATPEENQQQREREAAATVRSAFNRAPRPPRTATTGLPNSLREALLRREQAPLLRVLDGLLLHGVPTGALLTEKQIVDMLAGAVGRYSVLQALKANINGVPVFASNDPLPRPHTPTDVAISDHPAEQKKCVQLGVTLSDKNRGRGRPARRYQMPSIEGLCRALGLRWTRSDPLTTEDLRSPAAYRRGMHREFIKRRPGAYHVKLLARRLFVVDRTIQRYNQVCGVVVRPLYERFPVSMGMMHVIAAPTPNMFLEDVRGKRYPCKPEIAKRLMARDLFPLLCYQGFSHYTHPEGLQRAPGLSMEVRPETQDPDSVFYIPPIEPLTLQGLNKAKAAQNAPQRDNKGTVTASARSRQQATPSPDAPKLKVRTYRRPLPDASLEAAAARLYHHVCDLVAQARGQAEGTLSMANARRLAVEFGVALLARCQRTIHQRHNIRNYAGFVVSFLRSEANVQRLRAAANAAR